MILQHSLKFKIWYNWPFQKAFPRYVIWS